MRSTLSLALASATLLAQGARALVDAEALLRYRQLNPIVAQGCYSSNTGLTRVTPDLTWNTKSSCQGACAPSNAVEATSDGGQCWCGNELPPASDKVDDSFCNMGCTGYQDEMCGGAGYYSVYLTGTTVSAPNAAGDDSSASSSSHHTTSASSAKPTSATPSQASTTGSASPSLVTVQGQGQTVYVTPVSAASTGSPTATNHSSSGSGGPNKAAIAAGVVVGVVAAAALVGGLFFFLRNRKRKEVEEEHKKQAAMSSFANPGKPPGTSGGSSMADTRLEPSVMFSRRMSDGSIADNQDYSRRILKVTNL